MQTQTKGLCRSAIGIVVALSVIGAACGSDDDSGAAAEQTTTAVASDTAETTDVADTPAPTDDTPGATEAPAETDPAPDAPSIVSDAPLQQTELTIPNISDSILLLPRMIAVEEGIFDKHGLDVTVIDAPSTRGIDLFLSGEYVFGPAFGGIIAPIVATGTDIELYGLSGDVSTYSFWVTPEIESLEDLAGHTVGISGFGGKPELTTRKIFEMHGFDADSVNFQPLGNVGAIVQAMIAGQVQAGAFGAPSSTVAADNGMRMLFSPQELDIPDFTTPLVGDPNWVAENQDSAKAFARAWAESQWIALSDPERAMAAFAAAMEQDIEADAELIQAAYDEWLIGALHPADIGRDIERHLPLVYEGFDQMERIADERVVLPSSDLFGALADEGLFEALEAEYGPITSVERR